MASNRIPGLCFLTSCVLVLVYSVTTKQTALIIFSIALTTGSAVALILASANPFSRLRNLGKGINRKWLCLPLFALLLVASAPTASAQSPTPTPQASPQATPPDNAGQPSAQLSELLNHVRELVPYIRRQIERPMLTKFRTLAMILGSLVLLFSFIRVLRENDGASHELYYWIARAAIFMAFFAMGPAIVSTLYKIGRTLTIPIESSIEEKRQAFDDNYYKFVHGTYIVRDDKHIFQDPIYLKPGEDPWVGPLTDGEVGSAGKVKGLDEIQAQANKLWNMDTLFFLLNIARGILQAGEIFLLLLGGFIMVGLRLAAPFMVAVGIDKKLAEKITYPFVWGTIVFTLVFPVVRDVLTYIAYTVGSFGLMLFKGEPIYNIDDTTASIVKSAAYYDPKMIIVISLVTMTISGLMLWLSPYLAYRIATGQVFEAVSSTASGWMAAIVGSTVEYVGLKTGASLQRQAENTQTQAGWTAEMTRAKGTLEVSNLGAQARKVSGLAQIQGGLAGQLGAIWGGATTGVRMALATQNMTIASTHAQVGDSNRQVFARRDQSIQQAKYQQGNDAIRQAGESYARKEEIFGQYFTAVPMVGVIPASQMSGYANTDRTRTNNAAINNQAIQTGWNETATAERVVNSQNTYQQNIETAAKEQYEANRSAIYAGAGQAAGGAERGAAIASGGVNKAYGLEMQANQVQFDTTKSAAATIRDAGFSAARMREISTVISGMARDMDRRIEEGMRQRY